MQAFYAILSVCVVILIAVFIAIGLSNKPAPPPIPQPNPVQLERQQLVIPADQMPSPPTVKTTIIERDRLVPVYIPRDKPEDTSPSPDQTQTPTAPSTIEP